MGRQPSGLRAHQEGLEAQRQREVHSVQRTQAQLVGVSLGSLRQVRMRSAVEVGVEVYLVRTNPPRRLEPRTVRVVFANRVVYLWLMRSIAGTEGGAPVTTGSANPPFTAFTEKDSVNSNVTLQYQSISAMPQYRSASFEVSCAPIPHRLLHEQRFTYLPWLGTPAPRLPAGSKNSRGLRTIRIQCSVSADYGWLWTARRPTHSYGHHLRRVWQH